MSDIMLSRKRIAGLSALLIGACLVFAWNIGAQGTDPAKRSDAMPDLGAGASLRGKRVFPADNPWNQDISAAPVDPNSAKLIASIGLDKTLHPDFGTEWEGVPNGIPYFVVSRTQTRVPVVFEYVDESDPGPYPIPPDAPADNGSDWYLSGAPDPRWNDDDLRTLRSLKGSDFEVVRMGTVESK
jgi:hypothetical protein